MLPIQHSRRADVDALIELVTDGGVAAHARLDQTIAMLHDDPHCAVVVALEAAKRASLAGIDTGDQIADHLVAVVGLVMKVPDPTQGRMADVLADVIGMLDEAPRQTVAVALALVGELARR
jgi:hypothetical protein